MCGRRTRPWTFASTNRPRLACSSANFTRLLALPLRTRDGQSIDYWLHGADDDARLDPMSRLNEIEVPTHGLVLGASRSALDIRAELDRTLRGIAGDIQQTINEEIQKGLDEIQAAVTGDVTAVIRDVRERVTRQVTDLIPGRGKGVRAQFRAMVALRKAARTGAWAEYEDAIELGLRRARRYASGAWRALGALAATTGGAGAAGVATGVATAVVVTTVTLGSVVTLAEGPQGEQGQQGIIGSTGAQGPQGEEGDPGPMGPPGQVPTTVPPALASYTVAAGDTLWDITRTVCGDAPVRQTVRRMLAIWVTNMELIGSDPSSIDIGQELLYPDPCD